MPQLTNPDDMMLVDDILVGWRSKRRNTPATPAARDNARRTVTTFARWLAAERGVTLWDARSSDCQDWIDMRHGEVKARTVAKNWSELRAFYSTAEVDRAKPLQGRPSPMATVLMPAYGKHPETHVASPAEVERLVDTFDLRTGLGLRNATMVWLMFGSGLRCGETARVQFDHVDLDHRSVFLPVTKSMEERTAPLHPDAVTFLTRYIKRRGEEPGPLLVADGPRLRGVRVTESSIKNVIKRAVVKAGTKGVSPHALRRGFAVEWLTNGGSAADLMTICGWKSEVMIYNYLGRERSRSAMTNAQAVFARQLAGRRRLRSVV